MTVAEQPRLLVVDDEEAICEGCRRILTRQGYAVDKTSDPRDGLSRAAASNYAAILLDIKMPEMTGLDFLEQLRRTRQDIPVILMTGFPSVPTAVSAISLGAAGYVTKPFTPEEITQAVHRFALQGRTALSEAVSGGDESVSLTQPAPGTPVRFWNEAWLRETPQSAYRCGGLLAGLQPNQIESVRLPKIGEVVYQGLPMASVTTRSGQVHVVPAPLTGVVETVHSQLTDRLDVLVSDPCGEGWLAEVCPTRDESEINDCQVHNVLVLSANVEAAEPQMTRLQLCGCDVRAYMGRGTGRSWEEVAARLASEHNDLVWMDAASLGEEGPKMAAQINVVAPATKIVVVASAACPWESAYRAARIFYYAVEPLENPEVVEIVNSAFAMPVVRRGRDNRAATVERIAQIQITNRQGEDVILLAAPGMLYRNAGLGAEIRGLIYDRLYPVQTIPGKASVAPRDVLNLAHKCDRVVVLESKDVGRLPGAMVRDKQAELASLGGDDAARVTTLTIQPPGDDPCVDTLDSRLIVQLARHIVELMAGN